MVSFAEWFMNVMKEIGLYRIWIPFLFTWVVLYALIKMFFGDKIKNDKLIAAISFLTSFFVIYTAQATEILNYYVAILAAFAIFLFLGLIVLGLFGIKIEDLQKLKEKSWANIILLVVFVVLFFIALNIAYGKRISAYLTGGQVNVTDPFALAMLAVTHPAVIGTFFTLIMFGILAYLLIEQQQ